MHDPEPLPPPRIEPPTIPLAPCIWNWYMIGATGPYPFCIHLTQQVSWYTRLMTRLLLGSHWTRFGSPPITNWPPKDSTP